MMCVRAFNGERHLLTDSAARAVTFPSISSCNCCISTHASVCRRPRRCGIDSSWITLWTCPSALVSPFARRLCVPLALVLRSPPSTRCARLRDVDTLLTPGVDYHEFQTKQRRRAKKHKVKLASPEDKKRKRSPSRSRDERRSHHRSSSHSHSHDTRPASTRDSSRHRDSSAHASSSNGDTERRRSSSTREAAHSKDATGSHTSSSARSSRDHGSNGVSASGASTSASARPGATSTGAVAGAGAGAGAGPGAGAGAAMQYRPSPHAASHARYGAGSHGVPPPPPPAPPRPPQFAGGASGAGGGRGRVFPPQHYQPRPFPPYGRPGRLQLPPCSNGGEGDQRSRLRGLCTGTYGAPHHVQPQTHPMAWRGPAYQQAPGHHAPYRKYQQCSAAQPPALNHVSTMRSAHARGLPRLSTARTASSLPSSSSRSSSSKDAGPATGTAAASLLASHAFVFGSSKNHIGVLDVQACVVVLHAAAGISR